MNKKQIPRGEASSIELVCGQDVFKLGIRDYDGWNITAFLDHLELCEKCFQHKAALVNALNKMIGSNSPGAYYFD